MKLLKLPNLPHFPKIIVLVSLDQSWSFLRMQHTFVSCEVCVGKSASEIKKKSFIHVAVSPLT